MGVTVAQGQALFRITGAREVDNLDGCGSPDGMIGAPTCMASLKTPSYGRRWWPGWQPVVACLDL